MPQQLTSHTRKVKIVMRLNAPDDGAMLVLGNHFQLLLIGPSRKLGDLPVGLFKVDDLAADRHVVRLCIKREVSAEYLRVLGAVHLQPFLPALSGVVHTLRALEVVVPVPFISGLLLDERDGVFDFTGRVFLHVVLPVPQRRRQLEHRDALHIDEPA
jgi:hypothetical protein